MRVAGYAKQIDCKAIKLGDGTTRNGYHMIGFFTTAKSEEPVETMCITKEKWEQIEDLEGAERDTALLKMAVYQMQNQETGEKFYMAGRDATLSVKFTGKAIAVK